MTTKPIIEFKKLKIASSLSEETVAYTADIYVDGVLFCHASNHGQGGPDKYDAPNRVNYHTFDERLAELNERIAATYPAIQYGDTVLGDADLESVVAEMLADEETNKYLKGQLSRKFMFVTPDNKIREISRKKTTPDEIRKLIADKFPGGKLLNDRPITETREAFIKAGLLIAA